MAKKTTEKESSISTGRFFELHFLCDFMEYARKKGNFHDLFQPFVDDKGIDFVIRTKPTKRGGEAEYREIQIKGRLPNHIFTISKDIDARDNYWFVFYCKKKDSTPDNPKYNRYIMKSKEVKERLDKDKKNHHITFPVDQEDDDFDEMFK